MSERTTLLFLDSNHHFGPRVLYCFKDMRGRILQALEVLTGMMQDTQGFISKSIPARDIRVIDPFEDFLGGLKSFQSMETNVPRPTPRSGQQDNKVVT